MEEPAEKGGERTAPAETVTAAVAARDAHTPRLFYSTRSAECKAQHATKPPSVNCKIKCDTPEGASNGKAREKHIHSISWMQRHVAAGGVWGVGAQPLPILPGQCRREVSKGDEREALSFGRWGQGRRKASPASSLSSGHKMGAFPCQIRYHTGITIIN